ncbi:MAG: ATP-binding protein [Clostridiales bacterium]|nr:ATP-binding protein [Clostridiales bacterium]
MVAFVNTNGDAIYIGVKDDGEIQKLKCEKW